MMEYGFSYTAPVTVVGAGPVGLFTAIALAKHGVRCTLVEKRLEATLWPKMDMTNARSMELLNRLGLAKEFREIAVLEEHHLHVLFSTGLSDDDKGEVLEKWDLPSPLECRKTAATENTGIHPWEPYVRCSQSIFERWLRKVCHAHPLIDLQVGLAFESLVEDESGVTVTAKSEDGATKTIRSTYLVACDGAKSRVRRALNIGITGGPLPLQLYLVHFRSNDLKRLHCQGRFWHIFFTGGGTIISQDEKEIFTAHLGVPLDVDTKALDPCETVYKVLGGSCSPYKIKIDEIIVDCPWHPWVCVADSYRSKEGRVFLAGDAAHQVVPTGGYGMNTGLADAYDVAWKLAAVHNGHADEKILTTYESERRPVAERIVHYSAEHMQHLVNMWTWVGNAPQGTVLDTKGAEGLALRERIRKSVRENDAENKSTGIELDYRFEESPIVVQEADSSSPEWKQRHYVPSTKPGHRAPHVLLTDGKTGILDLYGLEYTLVDFSKDGRQAMVVLDAAKETGFPVTYIHLPDEVHVRSIWERDLVLVRPDGFVAWRAADDAALTAEEMKKVLERVSAKGMDVGKKIG